MQMPVLKEVLDALNIPRYELEGWEADDLIGTISRRCEADGWECVVVTGDKDSLQLITDHTKVKLVSTRMGQTTTRDMTEETFREQYGFAPIHMIDLKALMGDASDNIPGVPGVGEKTAMGLVQMYGSIDRLYNHMPEIVTAPETPARPNVVKKLAEGEESARHSYWLATIATDAPLDFRPEENLVRAPGPEAYPLFLRLEFSKLIEKFGLTADTLRLHRDRGAGDRSEAGGAAAGNLAEGRPRFPVGLAGLERHIGDMPDWGEHHHDSGAVLRQVPGGLERSVGGSLLRGYPEGLSQC